MTVPTSLPASLAIAGIPLPPPPIPENTALVQFMDTNLNPIGMIEFASITATLYYNQVGSWQILMPYTDAVWNQIMSKTDMLIDVNWRGLFHFGGKVEQPAYSNSIPGASSGSSMGGSSGGGGSGGAYITLSGADYLAIIANRICYPDPTKAWASQLPDSGDAVLGMPLETAIKYYVNRNVGPQALAARRHPLLDIASDQKRGPAVSYLVNFKSGKSLNLLEVIRALISQNNPVTATQMGIRLTPNPANPNRLLFDVYTPIDKSGTVWFSEELGNLTAINFALADPTCTDALVQGASPLQDTTKNPPVNLPNPPHNPFVQQSASTKTAWNMVEQYVDTSSETNESNVKTSASNTLQSGTIGASMSATVSDTPLCIYGRDYAIGDIVTVEVRPGNTDAVYTDIVTSVTLVADGSATPVIGAVPVVGNPADAQSTDKTVIGQMINRIKNLEKKLATQGR